MVTGSLPISMRIIRSERIIYIKYKQEVFSMIYQETYTLANGNKIPKALSVHGRPRSRTPRES